MSMKKFATVSQLVASPSDEDFHYGFNCVLQQRKVISVAFAWLQEHLLWIGVSWEAGCPPLHLRVQDALTFIHDMMQPFVVA